MRFTKSLVAGALATLLAVTVPTATAGADTGYAGNSSLTITGRGRAHGVGLCMASVGNMARAGYSYSYILQYFYRGTRVRYKRLPRTVRVGVYKRNGAISVARGVGNYFSVRTTTGRLLFRGGGGRVVTVYRSSGAYTVLLKKSGTTIGRRRSTAPIRVVPGRGTILKVVNDGQLYRGNIDLRYGWGSRAMWAINTVAIEHYLRGIGEEPESWPYTGLKVLAVVSRGYAAYRALNPKHASDGFAICNTGDCQAYVGYNYERRAPRLRSAVIGTRGRVVTYRGSLVVTPYFSNSGGRTESIQYVWGGSAKPWLRAVTTRWAKPHAAYSWTVPLTFSQLEIRLARSSATKLRGDLAGFTILSTGASPRVRSMRINGTGGYRTVSGEQFRSVVSLQSTWFRFDMPPKITSMSASPREFSPDGDGVDDLARMYFTISENATVDYGIYNTSGARLLSSGSWSRNAGRTSLTWDGKDASGNTMADGYYRMLVCAQDWRKNKNYGWQWFTLNRLLGFVSSQPTTITPNADGVDDTATVSFRLTRQATVNVHVDDASGTLVRTLTNGTRDAGVAQVDWDGKDAAGNVVAPGTYRYTVTANDGTFSTTRTGNIVVSAS